jgi:hypothetical protein
MIRWPSGDGSVKTQDSRLKTHLSAKARPGKQGEAGQGKTRPVAMDRIAGMRWAKMMKEGGPVRSWLAA